MIKRILLLAALGAALMSCRQEEAPFPALQEPVRMIAEDADPVRVSYGDAVSELEAMLEAMVCCNWIKVLPFPGRENNFLEVLWFEYRFTNKFY